ncbi:hypothetical protein [Thauera humireducens]|uniref:hypothetical protein n=1 Tax=Thauera humireducens TaxID=1134435 RepID=UPI00311E7E55
MADIQGGLAPRPPEAPHAPLLKAILMLLGAVTLFVLLDATASHLGKTYPVPMLVWARYTVHCLLMVVFLAPSMRLRLGQHRSPKPADRSRPVPARHHLFRHGRLHPHATGRDDGDHLPLAAPRHRARRPPARRTHRRCAGRLRSAVSSACC